ncbi:MAG TPA: TerC family protein [Opitutaceae bacterium]|nr:TerC family protein [Opitutaceae bacterium]
MLTLAATLSNHPQTFWDWVIAIFYIVWIDIVLAGDNAVVIALAVRNLPPKQRKMGIMLGAGAAVLLRTLLTAVTTKLLTIPYLKLIGGLMILWIAFKLLRQHESEHGSEKGGAEGLWQAVWMIIVADITMSLDNVMAVGGAAGGNNALIIFGLALSIPLVVFGSNLISRLMAKYQIIVFIGAAILGKVGGEMIMTDRIVHAALMPWWANLTGAVNPARAYEWLRYGLELALVLIIFFYGWSGRRKTPHESPAPPSPP